MSNVSNVWSFKILSFMTAAGNAGTLYNYCTITIILPLVKHYHLVYKWTCILNLFWVISSNEFKNWLPIEESCFKEAWTAFEDFPWSFDTPRALKNSTNKPVKQITHWDYLWKDTCDFWSETVVKAEKQLISKTHNLYNGQFMFKSTHCRQALFWLVFVTCAIVSNYFLVVGFLLQLFTYECHCD